MHADWLIPDWPAPKGVRAVFTTRAGGVSAVPYDSLNLGDHVGDLPAQVQANRALLQRATGTRAVFLQQVHGSDVLVLDAATPQGQPADACVTAQRKLACTIMVADCLPVLLATEAGSVVAAAHAGWRGLAGGGGGRGKGVLESVCEAFSALAQVKRAHSAIKTIAWLGPCIGPSAFEVGSEVKAAFEAVQPEAGRLFVEIGEKGKGKYLANLPALARLRLQALGITQIYGNDGSAPWCTVSN
ncbi:MAG: peptidoglycan editing factor PgeF, partial [Polaromonas sp.]